MRQLLVVALTAVAGCSSQPKVDPQLEADSLLFCRAWDAKGRPDSISGISGYLTENIKSHEILDVLSSKRAEDPRETFKQLRRVFKTAGIVHCLTLDWLEARYERMNHGGWVSP
jgi:hypothetical protein